VSTQTKSDWEVESLVERPLLTHEIGSLDKPGWRVKAYAGKKLAESDVEEARVWGERLDVEGYEDLLDLLRRSPITSREGKAEIKKWGSRYGLALQKSSRS
jgi:5-methyltetrahydropteroyltriglutamate--homocysteine methyltransferase